jgi:tyrosyl-tRNA synthetase
MTTIQQLMAEHAKDESKRIAQHKLAYEFVELVYGMGAAQKAEEQHRTLFGKSLSVKDIRAASPTPSPSLAATKHTNPHTTNTDINPVLNKRAPQTNITNMGPVQITLPWSLVRNQPMSKILWHAGLVSSRSEGQRLINAGGAHVGGSPDESGPMGDDLSFAPIRSSHREGTERYIIDDDLLVLRVGKWKMKVIKLVSDDEFRESGGSCPGWDEAEAQLA